ncbi:MAG: S9 family peptidase [Paludibacteraceae bacterium]|nr:S9 family peptidase [Paludibacteraceae bacterium]
MKTWKVIIMAAVTILGASCAKENTAEQKAPITKPQITIEGGRLTPEGLWAMGRIGSVKSDVETGLLAYTVSYYSVEENRSTTWIRICNPFENMAVVDEFVGYEPAWFGNSGALAYLKGGKLFIRRDKEEVEVMPNDQMVNDPYGEADRMNGVNKEMINDIEGFLLSPMRDKIILVKQVKTVPSTADKYPDLPLATGHMHEDLMYKHWDEWTETAPQPFVCELETEYFGEGERMKSAKLGEGYNILEGTAFESPMKPFGGIEQLAWNPNNEEIAYTCRKKTGLEYAVSTNSDIYLFDLRTRTHKNITEENKGYDTNPSYSPDGKWIAWQSMARDGYESDENRLMVLNMETGEKRFLSRSMDTNVDEYKWIDDTSLVFTACKQATVQLYRVTLDGWTSKLTDGQWDLGLGDVTDYQAYLLGHSMRQANEIYHLDIREWLRKDHEQMAHTEIYYDQPFDTYNQLLEQLTHENDNIYSQIERSTVEPRWQKTTDGKDMLTWIIYPPHFDPAKKYPTILYCEGGPQSPVSQFWSFRWNFMMMSAGDYIIVAPNRRGLPGFGKAWNEEISGDYGGQCMKDYFTAIDEFCKEPYVDKDHLGCVGASFGGFSVYWIAGHHDGRFKAFIAHDGIFNLEMQYLETEEKWFANWDMGGAYWEKDNKIAQRTFANSPHRFVDKWDTPILCIHGEKDYRILANQAMAAFDAAKMRGVPAELLIFPDENHWVLKPQNGILWQREFRNWLDRWLKEN